MNGAVLCLSYAVSIMSLILISLNRYCKVCHRAAFRRLFSARRNRFICLALWLLGLLLNTAAFVPSDTPFGYDPASHICNPRAGRTGRPEYSSVVMVAILVVPVFLIGFFNAAIFKHWRGSRLRLQRIRADGGTGTGTGTGKGRGWRWANTTWAGRVTVERAGLSSSEPDKNGIELKGYSTSESTSVVHIPSVCNDTSVIEEREPTSPENGAEGRSESPGHPHPPTTTTTPKGDILIEQKTEKLVATIITTTTEAEIITSGNGGFSAVGDDSELVGVAQRQRDDVEGGQSTQATLPLLPPKTTDRESPSKKTTQTAEEDLNASINHLDRIADAIASIERNSRFLDPPTPPPPPPALSATLVPDDESVKVKKKKWSMKRKASDQSDGGCRPLSFHLPRLGNDAAAAAAKTSGSKRLVSTFRIPRHQHYPTFTGTGSRGKHQHHKEGSGTRSAQFSKNLRRPSFKSLLMDAEFLWWSDIHIADAAPAVDPGQDPYPYRDSRVSRECFDSTGNALDDSFSGTDVIARFIEESDTDTITRVSVGADDSLPSTLDRTGDDVDNDDDDVGGARALTLTGARGVWHPSIPRIGPYQKSRAIGKPRGGGQINWRRALSLARRKTASDMALVRSLLVISVILFLLYIPFAVYLVLTFFPRFTVPPQVPVLATLFLFVNCAVNWIVYGIMNTAFRHAYVSTLKNAAICCVRSVTGATAAWPSPPQSPTPGRDWVNSPTTAG